MKNKKILLISFLVAILIIILVVIFILLKNNKGKYFNFEDIPNNSEVQLPIDSKIKAATFIKGFDNFEDQIKEESNNLSNRGINPEWDILVISDKLNRTSWNAEISSVNIIPSFKCHLTFSIDGEITSNNGCRWFK